ncbi:MAG TPA: hypothetical protein DDW52_26270 [Planctomycetaceae bacterium]|nr:hypothetical protein [Planctomycetaceae bacterium]
MKMSSNPSPEDSDSAAGESARIVELEIVLTHQQRLLDELNGVVVQQSLAIQKLERELKAMRDEQKALREHVNEKEANLPHEKPPHY